MCNFVIRPIKSYFTAPTHVNDGEDVFKFERGESVLVLYANEKGVMVKANNDKEFLFGYEQFTHIFTADPEDIKKVKEEEAKWFPKKKEDKKDSKKS